MNSIIITPKSEEELNFIKEILRRMNIASAELSNEEKEDIGLVELMKKVDRKEKVSKETVMKSLGI
ncbi:hypothetical protein [Williamwhitmania taraxaci]|uniref:Uncharacterized protein n=1 Tax=Williamwhitmania taraxaci TaxID=1640674 RepID=A0A1G6HFK5_9BACT|nr:hypothetical protein [Williamwhitmania taraxaci]SDB92216.1 hypothetical protein SAMN05216323_100978 [Williamwhitmania taraxaci]